jgi:NodT family efflux transporter outer membrane factor (OMF) lipoprotein
MKTLPLLLAGGALLALTACNFAPHYERPPTESAPAFKEAVPDGASAAQGWKAAEPHDTALPGKWWELYQDPQLNALEERVAISNQTVAAAEANYRVARALLVEAQASLFPSVSAVPSVVRSRASASASSSATPGGGASSTGTVSPGSTASNTGTRTLYTAPLEASYQVDFWGRIRNTIAQSKYSSQASAADVATALLSTQDQLAQDYFQLRAVDEQRRILDSTLGDYATSLKLVQSLYRNGLASDEDLAEAETQLDSAEAQATDLGVARAQYEHALAVLIGVSPAQFSLPFSPFNPAVPTVPVGLPSDLLERRPDIAASERQVAAANAGIGIARAAYFPNVTLSGSGGFESTGLSHLFDWPNRFWSLGASATQPIFEGGGLAAVTAQAHAQYDETVADYRQTVLAAFQAVEDNLVSLRVLSKEVGQQHRAAAAAQRELTLSLARYKLGLDSYVNVITAQNTFLTNREAELQVEIRRLVASVSLINNLGGGWDTSLLEQTEATALHPPGAGQKPTIPPPDAASVPNPAPLPNPVNLPVEPGTDEPAVAPAHASG